WSTTSVSMNAASPTASAWCSLRTSGGSHSECRSKLKRPGDILVPLSNRHTPCAVTRRNTSIPLVPAAIVRVLAHYNPTIPHFPYRPPPIAVSTSPASAEFPPAAPPSVLARASRQALLGSCLFAKQAQAVECSRPSPPCP